MVCPRGLGAIIRISRFGICMFHAGCTRATNGRKWHVAGRIHAYLGDDSPWLSGYSRVPVTALQYLEYIGGRSGRHAPPYLSVISPMSATASSQSMRLLT